MCKSLLIMMIVITEYDMMGMRMVKGRQLGKDH